MTAGPGEPGVRVDEARSDAPTVSSNETSQQPTRPDLWVEETPDDATTAQGPGQSASAQGATQQSATRQPATPQADTATGVDELVPSSDRAQFQARWSEVQTMFVDEPRTAVDRADALVAEVLRAVTSGFAARKAGLEQRWSAGGDVATEDLRQALRSYRAFFERLLQI